MIATLGRLDVEAWRAPGRIGIWTNDNEREAKVGAIGIRVRRWVSLHGFSVNISPNLSHFGGIIPCGLPDFGVTSMAKLNKPASIPAFDSALYDGLTSFLAELR